MAEFLCPGICSRDALKESGPLSQGAVEWAILQDILIFVVPPWGT